MYLEKRLFEIYKGREIIEYHLKNNNHMEVKILNLGATIREIIYQGSNRVLGFDHIENYLNQGTYMGALVGRVAGRISGGKFIIEDKVYELDQNEGTTCLHGGNQGLSFQIWELEREIVTEDSVGVVLRYISSDLECGFPGRLDILVQYILGEDDSLTIEYFAETDKDTIITLTNHSYFNLNNLNEDILNHELMMDANEYIRLNEMSLPIGVADVENTPFDFRDGKKILKDMDLSHSELIHSKGYDHPFVLNKNNNTPITLSSRKSGVKLSIETSEPVVILYCSNKLKEDLHLSNGTKTFQYQGLCLETQWYPDAINQVFLPINVLKSHEQYYSRTRYKFELI